MLPNTRRPSFSTPLFSVRYFFACQQNQQRLSVFDAAWPGSGQEEGHCIISQQWAETVNTPHWNTSGKNVVVVVIILVLLSSVWDQSGDPWTPRGHWCNCRRSVGRRILSFFLSFWKDAAYFFVILKLAQLYLFYANWNLIIIIINFFFLIYDPVSTK